MGLFFLCLLLGTAQGIAEFLPISSSGHLALIEAFFGERLTGIANLTAFNLLLHLGTLCSVLIVYRKDVAALIPALFGIPGKLIGRMRGKGPLSFTYEEKTVLLVIAATLPLVLLKGADLLVRKLCGAGVLALIDRYITRSPVIVGVLLVFNGLLLFFSDRIGKREKGLADMGARGALFVGTCQLCAVLPGLSRSGCTVTGGRLCALSGEEAVRFSFLLSIPAILGSCVSEIPSAFADGAFSLSALPAYLAGTAAAFAAGLLSVGLLKLAARRSGFRFFSYYCWGVGAPAIVCGLLLL